MPHGARKGQPVERVTKPLLCGHKITISGRLKMGEFRRWTEAETQGDLATCYEYLARLIEAWDWEELDPRNTASYDELEMREYRQINEAVAEYLRAEGLAKN